MSNNIPCPYYFLYKIKKTLKNNNFYRFLDLGCGFGRVINFFNKNFYNRNFIGIEYFSDQYEYCKKSFQNKKKYKDYSSRFHKIGFFSI